MYPATKYKLEYIRKTSVALVEWFNNKYDRTRLKPTSIHTRKIIRTTPVKATYHDSYGGAKELLRRESGFFWFFILIVLWNACVTLLNLKSFSNPSPMQGNAKKKKKQPKHYCDAWANSGLACLSSVLLQHLVISFIVLILFCRLNFVHLAVFHLGVLFDNGWMIGT